MKEITHLFLLLTIISSGNLFGQIECEINPSDFEFSMTVTSVIEINGHETVDVNDMILAYRGEQCSGKANPVYFQQIDR